MKNPAAVALGRLGGKAGRGRAKARTSEQARAAAQARWAKRKSLKRVGGALTGDPWLVWPDRVSVIS